MSGNNYDIAHRPEEQKLFTTDEIAEMLDCTTSVIRNITSYYHIESEKVQKTKRARKALYSYEAFKQIKERHEARKNKARQKQIFATREMTPEEIAALEDHTLVTDCRCLDFNYWPEVIPACFQEVEKND